MSYTYAELAGMIDHSLLHPTLTEREVEKGCALAREYEVASVCVKPCDVAVAAKLLRGSKVAVGAVVGFPHGSNKSEVKRYETELACKDGATEIDMVLNLGRAFGGDWSYLKEDILGVTREAHGRGALVKVILETDFLSNDDLKKKLCEVCESAAADFVKTSTGFGFVKLADGNYNYHGATEHDIRLMRATCTSAVQVKASGGVRDLQSLIRVRELGATRCGTSATKSILDEWHRIHGSRGLETTSGQVESGTGY